MREKTNKLLTDNEFKEIINNPYSNEYDLDEIPELKYFSIRSYCID